MLEKSRSLYLNIPGTGILVFDRFGNYTRTLPVETPTSFQVTDSHIYYMKGGGLFSLDLSTVEIARLELPVTGNFNHESVAENGTLIKAELQPGLLFLYSSGGYSVYRTDL
jgi:hypothetical protein